MYEVYNSKWNTLLRYVYKMKTLHIFHFITNNGTFIFNITHHTIVQVHIKGWDLTLEKCFLCYIN